MNRKEFKVSRGRNVFRQVGRVLLAIMIAGGVSVVLLNLLRTSGIVSAYRLSPLQIIITIAIYALALFIAIDFKPTRVIVDEDGVYHYRGSKETFYPYSDNAFSSYVVVHRYNGVPTNTELYIDVENLVGQKNSRIKLIGFKREMLNEIMGEIKLRTLGDLDNFVIPNETFVIKNYKKEDKVYLSVEISPNGIRFDHDNYYEWSTVDSIKMTPVNYSGKGFGNYRTINLVVMGKRISYKAGPAAGKDVSHEVYRELNHLLDVIMLKNRGVSVNDL